MAVENVTRIPALVQKISRGECVDGEKWFVLQIILEWCNIAPQGHEGMDPVVLEPLLRDAAPAASTAYFTRASTGKVGLSGAFSFQAKLLKALGEQVYGQPIVSKVTQTTIQVDGKQISQRVYRVNLVIKPAYTHLFPNTPLPTVGATTRFYFQSGFHANHIRGIPEARSALKSLSNARTASIGLLRAAQQDDTIDFASDMIYPQNMGELVLSYKSSGLSRYRFDLLEYTHVPLALADGPPTADRVENSLQHLLHHAVPAGEQVVLHWVRPDCVIGSLRTLAIISRTYTSISHGDGANVWWSFGVEAFSLSPERVQLNPGVRSQVVYLSFLELDALYRAAKHLEWPLDENELAPFVADPVRRKLIATLGEAIGGKTEKEYYSAFQSILKGAYPGLDLLNPVVNGPDESEEDEDELEDDSEDSQSASSSSDGSDDSAVVVVPAKGKGKMVVLPESTAAESTAAESTAAESDDSIVVVVPAKRKMVGLAESDAAADIAAANFLSPTRRPLQQIDLIASDNGDDGDDERDAPSAKAGSRELGAKRQRIDQGLSRVGVPVRRSDDDDEDEDEEEACACKDEGDDQDEDEEEGYGSEHEDEGREGAKSTIKGDILLTFKCFMRKHGRDELAALAVELGLREAFAEELSDEKLFGAVFDLLDGQDPDDIADGLILADEDEGGQQSEQEDEDDEEDLEDEEEDEAALEKAAFEVLSSDDEMDT